MEAMSGRVDLHLLNHDFRRQGGVTMGVEFLHSNVKKIYLSTKKPQLDRNTVNCLWKHLQVG